MSDAREMVERTRNGVLTKCPYDDVADCPLYIAAHYGGFGCDDGGIGDGRCGVDRGLDYNYELGRFRTAYPREVAMIEWNKTKRERAEQISRNMRMMGVH